MVGELLAGQRVPGVCHGPVRPAGGQFHPFGHYAHDRVTPEWRAQFAAALDYSWRRFQIMVGDDYGIRWLPTYAETGGGPERAAGPMARP